MGSVLILLFTVLYFMYKWASFFSEITDFSLKKLSYILLWKGFLSLLIHRIKTIFSIYVAHCKIYTVFQSQSECTQYSLNYYIFNEQNNVDLFWFIHQSYKILFSSNIICCQMETKYKLCINCILQQ
jgi:hypothetical protein